MTPAADTTRYTNHRCPGEIIRQGAWLYSRGTMSSHDVQELRCQRPRPGDKGQLDEVWVPMNGKHHDLGRAVDQDANGLDIVVQSRRNTKAAKKFFKKCLQGWRSMPRVLMTEQRKS